MSVDELTAGQRLALEHNLAKMREDGARATSLRVFERYFRQVATGETGLVPEGSITPLTDVDTIDDADIDPAAARDALGKTVILKLNGGLGTSMGLDRAKSMLPVRDGKSFLDIISEQILHARAFTGIDIPIMFLNSFRTREDTLAVLRPELRGALPIDVLQNKEPKILRDTLEPAEWSEDPELEWCPPGHGDIFTTLYETKILDSLLDAGYRYLNSSNADNLGAYPSATLAGWFAGSGAEYSPEVCRRTPMDVKGGHLAIRKSDGRVILRDTGQTPPEDMDAFTDLHRHPYFHTNNLWFNIEALRDLLNATEGVVDLPLIRNEKTVDPRRSDSPQVVQMECAIGAIVEKFATSTPICVGRNRFLPVKTTNDLAVIRSDAYTYDDKARLVLLPEAAPVVRLDSRYYKFIHDFDAHFLDLPSLRGCTTFDVEGEWFFEGQVAFEGDVHLSGSGRVTGTPAK